MYMVPFVMKLTMVMATFWFVGPMPLHARRPDVPALFERLDSTCDGQVSKDEFRRMGMLGRGRFKERPALLERIFGRLDADGSDSLSLAEFGRLSELRRKGTLTARHSFTQTAHALTVDGRERAYIMQAPERHDGPLPVVLFFHGGGGRGENMARNGFRDMVAREGFIAVYPSGWRGNWNDGRNAARILSQQEDVDDVKFVRAIVQDIATGHRIDRSRIFATGVSNGGIFCHYLAATAADLVAAIAPVIGGLAEPIASSFMPSHPISLLVIQGDADPLVPKDGGPIGRSNRGGRVIPTEAMLGLYLARNGVSGQPTEEPLPDTDPDDGCRRSVRRYPPGEGGVKVEYWRIHGGGHTFPGSRRISTTDREARVGKTSRDYDGLEVIWRFFEACPAKASDNGSR